MRQHLLFETADQEVEMLSIYQNFQGFINIGEDGELFVK